MAFLVVLWDSQFSESTSPRAVTRAYCVPSGLWRMERQRLLPTSRLRLQQQSHTGQCVQPRRRHRRPDAGTCVLRTWRERDWGKALPAWGSPPSRIEENPGVSRGRCRRRFLPAELPGSWVMEGTRMFTKGSVQGCWGGGCGRGGTTGPSSRPACPTPVAGSLPPTKVVPVGTDPPIVMSGRDSGEGRFGETLILGSGIEPGQPA